MKNFMISRDGNTVHVGPIKLDEIFSIELPSYGTSGYLYSLDYIPTQLQYINRKRIPPEQGMIGGSGKEQILFKGLSSSKVYLSVTPRRPWEETGGNPFKICIEIE